MKTLKDVLADAKVSHYVKLMLASLAQRIRFDGKINDNEASYSLVKFADYVSKLSGGIASSSEVSAKLMAGGSFSKAILDIPIPDGDIPPITNPAPQDILDWIDRNFGAIVADLTADSTQEEATSVVRFTSPAITGITIPGASSLKMIVEVVVDVDAVDAVKASIIDTFKTVEFLK